MRDDSFGFELFLGETAVMATAHRHQEVELNLIIRGNLTYLFGGGTLHLSAGQLALFWATIPHRLIACDSDTELGWLTLPLASFLRYGLPERLRNTVLQGTPVSDTFGQLELLLFKRWRTDFQQGQDRRILELEPEAWLRRLAPAPQLNQRQRPNSKAADMAHYMSEHYQDPLRLTDIATAVELNPSYAATLFKNSFGMTMNDYLTQHRVAHAQRLLVTTDLPILELAFEAGFGSSSQFYSSFTRACGKTPMVYRKGLRQNLAGHSN